MQMPTNKAFQHKVFGKQMPMFIVNSVATLLAAWLACAYIAPLACVLGRHTSLQPDCSSSPSHVKAASQCPALGAAVDSCLTACQQPMQDSDLNLLLGLHCLLHSPWGGGGGFLTSICVTPYAMMAFLSTKPCLGLSYKNSPAPQTAVWSA